MWNLPNSSILQLCRFIVELLEKIGYTVNHTKHKRKERQMESNFAFLEEDFPVLAQFGRNAETYLYSDSNSCLMKLGMIGETIVNLMFTYDRISPPKVRKI